MLPIVQGSTKLGSLLCARLKGASGDMQSGGNKVDCGDFSNFTDDSEAKKVLKGRNKHCCNVLNSKVIVKSLRLYISSVFPTQPHKSQGMWKIFFFHSGTVPAWFLLVNWSRQGSPVFWPCPKKWKPKMNMLWWAAWTRGASAVSTQEKKNVSWLASQQQEWDGKLCERNTQRKALYLLASS